MKYKKLKYGVYINGYDSEDQNTLIYDIVLYISEHLFSLPCSKCGNLIG